MALKCDLQYGKGEALYKLSRVGVKGVRKPILVQRDGINGTLNNTLNCSIDIYVDLPAVQKGSHMSRNVEVINEDILKLDIASLTPEGKRFKVVANLPYYITTPIIMQLLENHAPVKSITIMVQKEVADRMQEGPGSKDYGALSLAIAYYAKAHIIMNVPPECFMPRPGVGSAVITLDLYEKPPIEVADEKLLFTIIRASFNQRRKTLYNGLTNSPEIDHSKEQIKEAITALGRGEMIRGEALSLEEFARLADYLHDL